MTILVTRKVNSALSLQYFAQNNNNNNNPDKTIDILHLKLNITARLIKGIAWRCRKENNAKLFEVTLKIAA